MKTIQISESVIHRWKQKIVHKIPQEEGITTVCRAYDTFHNNNPPIPTKYLREMLDLILKENSFQFNGENYLQTHGTAMGTKMAVAFANIFMAEFWNKTHLPKQNQANRMETLHRWRFLPME